jgi:type IV secretory pathway VirB3-like protein
MNNFKKYLVPLLLLMLLATGLRAPSFVMTNVIEPIALVFWVVWRIIASVDQILYWILLIAVCFLLVLRLIPNRDGATVKAAYNYKYRPGNRIDYWTSLIRDSALERESAEILHGNLKSLLTSVFQNSQDSRPIDVAELAAARKVPLSLETQRFLFSPGKLDKKVTLSATLSALLLRSRWLLGKTGETNDQDARSIDEIIRWIETEMEISNDT